MTSGITRPSYSQQPDDLPSTEALLTMGGDARIVLDPDSGLNKYGCAPVPDAGLLALGSSTASVISEAGFAAADSLRHRIVLAANTEPHAAIYTRELNRMRGELPSLCGVEDMAGPDCVFAASGTDTHLIAAQLAAYSPASPLLVVMANAEETGSGVPAALTGQHFSSRSALGKQVEAGTSIESGMAAEIASVALRRDDGSPRPMAELDGEFAALAGKAAAAGRRVLLIVSDVSKTGMVAPSPACISLLQRQLADDIEVLIDACQFRLAPATLRAYLECGCMVALTGSKFVGGPSFSGALLIPASSARRFRRRPFPRALATCSSRAEWPSSWALASALDDVANFGLLLRWEAALEELRRFRAVPEADVSNLLQDFADAVRGYMANHPLFEPLPVPQLDRQPLVAAESWDQIQTIFPFVLYRTTAGGRKPLTVGENRELYRLLQTDNFGPRYQLGQPVVCGLRDAVPLSALRLCAGARLVVEAARQEGGTARLTGQAQAALDKVAAIVATMPDS